MIKKQSVIHIRGTIINDSDRRIYEEYKKSYTSPSDIKLPNQKENIKVIINSQGGDVFAGSEIYTMLREYQGHVTVEIHSIAASIASVIAMAGDTVRISPTAQIMIHEASTTTIGNTSRHKGSIDVLDKINRSITTAYQRKTGLSGEELRKMMSEETWMTAQQAKSKGFVDEIMFTDKNNNVLMEDYYKNQRSQSRVVKQNSEPKRAFTKLFDSQNKQKTAQTSDPKRAFTKFFGL